jgi:hypothetical protein
VRSALKEAGSEATCRRTGTGYEGAADQGKRAYDCEAIATKDRTCKSGDGVVKAEILTWGDLALRLKGRRLWRSEKSAETVVAGSQASGEGPNGKESQPTREPRKRQTPEVRGNWSSGWKIGVKPCLAS